MNRALTIRLALAWTFAAGCLILAWHLSRATREIEAALDRSARVRDVWIRDLGNPKGQPAQMVSSAEASRHAVADPSVVPRRPPPAGPPSPSDRSRITKLALESVPEFRELQIKSRRAMIAMRYAPFYAALRLSPAEIEALEEVALEQQDLSRLIDNGAQTHDAPADQTPQGTLDDLNQARVELLGETRHQQLQHYEQTLPAREVVHLFAAKLAVNNVLLTASQADRLTEIIARTSPNYRSRADGVTINWADTLAAAQGELSGEQFERLQQFASRQHERALTERMLAAISEGKEPMSE